jgi:multidrug resistance efflux pump
MDFLGYSICDLCGLDRSEVLRRARSRLADPSLRHQAEFQHQASDRFVKVVQRVPVRIDFDRPLGQKCNVEGLLEP